MGSEMTSTHDLLDSATADRMYIDTGEVVRVRVEADEFYDDEPGPPKASEGVQQAKVENRRAPYTITVFILEYIPIPRTEVVTVFDCRARSWTGRVVEKTPASKRWTKAKERSHRAVSLWKFSRCRKFVRL